MPLRRGISSAKLTAGGSGIPLSVARCSSVPSPSLSTRDLMVASGSSGVGDSLGGPGLHVDSNAVLTGGSAAASSVGSELGRCQWMASCTMLTSLFPTPWMIASWNCAAINEQCHIGRILQVGELTSMTLPAAGKAFSVTVRLGGTVTALLTPALGRGGAVGSGSESVDTTTPSIAWYGCSASMVSACAATVSQHTGMRSIIGCEGGKRT
jgi:hypothetical protein